jgi:hypothetical protein
MMDIKVDIRERLKNITIDPLCKTSVTREIMMQIQRNNTLKLRISREINRMLEELYTPLGLWGQNPQSSDEDFGVLDKDGNWGIQNVFDTNYSCQEVLFNRCNLSILRLYRKKGIEDIEISGETFSYRNPIIIDDETLKDEKETLRRINKLLILIDNYKNKIFLPGSEIFDILINMCSNTMSRGDETQKFYVDNIYDFFDDIVEVKALGGLGNYDDRKKGIDVWTKHGDDKVLKHQIKGTCDLTSVNGGYLVNSALSQTSKCDLYVFVCEDYRILILKNNKYEMEWTKDGVFFPITLKVNEKFYTQ